MDVKIPSYLIQINHKISSSKFLKNFVFFIFLTLFISSKEQYQISLIIEGQGSQYFLNESYYLEPNEVIVNSQPRELCKKFCDFERDINFVIIRFNTQIESVANMFNGLTNIKEIDTSNFDFSKVTNMDSMFNGCSNLEKINFGNINTSLVENMERLFQNCISLTSINLSNFDTSLVTSMNSMFRECESLNSIDVSNFNTSNVEDMMDMFALNYNLISIELSNFNTSKVKNLKGMFYKCQTLKYLDLSNFDTTLVTNICSMFEQCSSLLYINFNSLRIGGGGEKETGYAFSSTPIELKICIYDSQTENLLLSWTVINSQTNLNCSDICFEKNIKINLKENRCLYSCNESESKYEYKNYCYEVCPNTTFISNNNEYLCSDKTFEDNYYFDIQKGVYKECYKTCKKCNNEGNETNNNCLECKDGFKFTNDSLLNNNCYEICNHYYYFDEFNIYKCTNNKTCPEKYNKLINEKNKCIDECKNDNIYRYQYNNICYEHCPDGTRETNYNCFLNEITEEDRIIKIFQEYIFNSDIIKNVTENKTDYILDKDNVIYQITTTENQKLNEYKNISSINLGNCEDILREKYKINETLPLIILKKDYKSPYTLIPIIDYEIYHPINKSKLNLEDCKDIKLNIPVSIDEEKIFIYEPKSEFYTDNCFPYTTENGTDIIITDRKQEFKKKNLSLCENNCEYTGYDINTKKSSCECNVKNKMESIHEIMNKSNLLFNNFSNEEDISNNIPSNMETMKCTKTLFSKEGIMNNISSYIIFIIIAHFLLTLILFMKCGISSLESDIEDILDSKKNSEENFGRKSQMIKGNKKLKENLNKTEKNFPPKKNRESIIINNSSKLIKSSKHVNKDSKNRESLLSFNTKMKKRKTKDLNGIDIILNKFGEKKEKESYNEYEINNLDYELAILYDKRTFCEYYISLLKIKHPIIFSFCPIRDYNMMMIKICIFSLSFSVYYVINLEFFNLKVIHKLYEDEGNYDFKYFLPKVALAFIICNFINIITKLIFLSERNILEIKKQTKFLEANNIASKVKRKFFIKCIIFFIIGILFQILFWFVLSSFGSVYQNSQVIVFENTLISFGISLIYPFFINIFPCILRIWSISSRIKCLHNFNKIFQMI